MLFNFILNLSIAFLHLFLNWTLEFRKKLYHQIFFFWINSFGVSVATCSMFKHPQTVEVKRAERLLAIIVITNHVAPPNRNRRLFQYQSTQWPNRLQWSCIASFDSTTPRCLHIVKPFNHYFNSIAAGLSLLATPRTGQLPRHLINHRLCYLVWHTAPHVSIYKFHTLFISVHLC